MAVRTTVVGGDGQESSGGGNVSDSGRATFAALHPMPAIVVVEDNKVNQKLLLRMLVKLGYSEQQVLTADNGHISLDVIKARTQQAKAPLLVFMVRQ